MHVKYALLHCSYSAPVRVPDTMSDTPSMAARETTGVALRADCIVVVAARVVASRDITPVESPRTVADVFCVWRGVRAVRAVVVSGRVGADTVVPVRETTGAAVRVVTARAATALVDAVRDVADCVADDGVPRLVTFSSRTAASAVPKQIAKIPIKCRIFFISIKC